MKEQGTEVEAEFRRLWELLWAGGVADPLTALEQVSFLLLLMRLELLDFAERADAHRLEKRFVSRFDRRDRCRWSQLLAAPAVEALETLRLELVPLLTDAGGRHFAAAMRDARFVLHDEELLRAVMELLDGLPFDLEHGGALYAQLLGAFGRDSRGGQLAAPPELVETMLRLVDPRPGEVVCDPAAGVGQFLVAAEAHLQRLAKRQRALVVGWNADIRLVRIACMNLLFHGARQPIVRCREPLRRYERMNTDCVVSWPPVGSHVDEQDVHPALQVGSGRVELMFIELCRRMLRADGRCALIVPEGVLVGISKAHIAVRRRLLQEASLQAVVSLPSDVFRPRAASVRAAILVFAEGGPTDRVLFFDGQAGEDGLGDGSSLHALRHVPDAIARHRVDSRRWNPSGLPAGVRERVWTATMERIAEKDFDLTPHAYQPQLIDEAEDASDPTALLEDVMRLEERFGSQLAALRKLLGSAP